MTFRVDHRRVLEGLLADDPDLIRRYHTSPTFRRGIDVWIEMVDAYVDGLADRADRTDAEIAQQIELLKRDPYAGPSSPSP